MPDEKKTPKGGRKFQHVREMMITIGVGYIVTIWLKADPQLFLTFCAAIGGLSTIFTAGNVKVHQAQSKPQSIATINT